MMDEETLKNVLERLDKKNQTSRTFFKQSKFYNVQEGCK